MGSDRAALKMLTAVSAAHISIFSQLRQSFRGRDRKARYRPVSFCGSQTGLLPRATDIL